VAPSGLYFTPRKARGIRRGIIIALNMTADNMADSGVASLITFSAWNPGIAIINIAGIMAKYFATSFAIENVVMLPLVMRRCLPISIT